MPGKILTAISIAFHNIKLNPLHTFLSTLGIVIGVAALVAILSLGDGLEQFARQQITETTSVKAVVVKSKTTERVDDIRVRLKNFPLITPDKFESLKNSLENAESMHLKSVGTAIFARMDSTVKAGARYNIVTRDSRDWAKDVASGTGFKKAADGILINPSLAKKLAQNEAPRELIGQKIILNGRPLSVQGILVKNSSGNPFAVLPYHLFSSRQLQSTPPILIVTAKRVEDVPEVKANIKEWLNANFTKGSDAFRVETNQQRLEQARTGIRIFKIVMGMITGIAVLVGGIGVMNVLLISITERTKEIGIRRAVGSDKRDIMFQFLSESIIVSVLGSLVGLVAGVLLSLAAIPIVGYLLSGIGFHVAFTAGTFLIIGILAVVIGIIFGTYPALKAAHLTPVDAIRHE